MNGKILWDKALHKNDCADESTARCSYHSFIFPFSWKRFSGKRAREGIWEIFEHDSPMNIWEKSDEQVIKNDRRQIPLADMQWQKDYYDTFQFFNEEGRNLIFGDEVSGLVRNFMIRDDILKGLQYVITIGNRVYELDVQNISMSIYNTGIGEIVISCVNEAYTRWEQIKEINEYGRRLSLPYWPDEKNGYKKCADCLEFRQKNGKCLSKDDFATFDEVNDQNVSLTYVSTVIRNLLNQNGQGIIFRGKEPSADNEIQIHSILDGKMFVACLIKDKEYLQTLLRDYEKNGDTFSELQSRNMAELLSVDLEGACSYGNHNERKQYLKNHLYVTEFYGEKPKLLALTEQSYIKLISEDVYEVSYFKNIYLALIKIGIVQRMSIAKFQQQIAHMSYGIENNGKDVNNRFIHSVMKLQERYVAFQNQFLLHEITVQREGKYLYQQIRTHFGIDAENANLSEHLNKLYELANIHQGYRLTIGALALSVVAIVITIIQMI